DVVAAVCRTLKIIMKSPLYVKCEVHWWLYCEKRLILRMECLEIVSADMPGREQAFRTLLTTLLILFYG
ncbi:MAG: hypothetical protein K2G18_09695, partial [Bacteroidales bacterium]|nr:hypothetical protein [Bacteroidales bacterium]